MFGLLLRFFRVNGKPLTSILGLTGGLIGSSGAGKTIKVSSIFVGCLKRSLLELVRFSLVQRPD